MTPVVPNSPESAPDESGHHVPAAPAPALLVRRGIVIYFLTLLYSTIMVALVSLCTNVFAYHHWTILNRMSPLLFMANVLIFQTAMILLHVLFNRWLLAATIWTAIVVALAVPDIVKLAMLNRPLLPWDFYLVGQMISLVPVMKEENNVFFGAIAAIPFALFFAIYFSFRPRRVIASPLYRRNAMILHAIAIFLIFGAFSQMRKSDASTGSGSISLSDQKQNYDNNGFLYSFLYNASFGMRDGAKPNHYSAEEVASSIERERRLLKKDAIVADAAKASEKVNVIMILLEAYSDPTNLPVKYSEDPIPFVHQLQKTAQSGELNVPTFGGYTSRTEFEALTGFSLRFLFEVSNPYTAYVHRTLPALPAVFKENGYRTVAIHPFEGSFWERNRAFPLLGFDKFIDQSQFVNPLRAGPLISDEAVTDKIIETSKASSDPFFIFGITMSTHAPFDYGKQVSEPIDVLTPMSESSKAVLKTYVNAVNRTDKALKRLVEHFEGDKRKTMILFFGDHLPMLGQRKEVYLETGFLADADEMPAKMYKTPVVAWANFDLPKQSLNRRASFLYSYVLESAGIPATSFSAVNLAESRLNPQLDDAAMNRDYESVQYDLLFGNQYALDIPFKPIDPKSGRRIATAAPAPNLHSFGSSVVTVKLASIK